MNQIKADSKAPQSNEELILFVEQLKQEWMATIDALVDPLAIISSDYKILKANKEMAKRASETEIKAVIGRKCHQVFAGIDSPCKGCKLQEVYSSEESQSFELKHEGSHFEVTGQPILQDGKEISGVVQVYRDRTQAKKLQEQLFQSEKLASIGLLAGGIAHEINNPLGGILIFTQMLLRETKEATTKTDLQEIEAATIRCKEIVTRLLDFARHQPSDISEKSLALTPIKITVEKALKFAAVGEQGKSCELICEWHDDSVQILADENKLVQLFLNLIQNSFQAMRSGTLHLTSKVIQEDKKDYVDIRLQDNGPGIPEKYLPRIFDPFFTTKDTGEGTGLGLAICYGIVTEFSGTISVESIEGEGTTFIMRFPKP